MLQKRSSLPRWRQRQVEVLRSVARRAQVITRTVKALPLASSSVMNLEARVRQINVAMLCLFCDVLGHQDTELPSLYLTGFNVSGVIKPSGVLRPLPPSLQSEADFWERHKSIMRTNGAWAHSMARVVQEDAR